MRSIDPTPIARAAAVCLGALLFAGSAQAAGDKSAYDQARTSSKAAYETASKRCDSLSGNAKDICVAEAKAVRTKADVDAEATYKNTPKARQHAIEESAEADYKVAKERCDDKAGNEKDVCMQEARAVMTKAKADAKATQKSTEARADASKDKREADYKVAAEKCDAMSGNAKDGCIKQAKARYGM
jgi:hypothetical protein